MATLWKRLEKCNQTIRAKSQSWETLLANAKKNSGERAEKFRCEAETARLTLVKLSAHKEKLKLKLEGKETELTDSETEEMAGNPWDQRGRTTL